MAKLTDIIAYLCYRVQREKGELTRGRITKLVFLADWRYAMAHGNTLTRVPWTFNEHGPDTKDILVAARASSDFDISEKTMYGKPAKVVTLKEQIDPSSRLTDDERSVLDGVISDVMPMSWTEFSAKVYATYPVATRDRYESLPLKEIAAEYKERQVAATDDRMNASNSPKLFHSPAASAQ